MEAPSAIAVVRQLFGPQVRVSFAEVPSPDPRLPLHDVPFVAWRYGESGGQLTTAAVPGLPPPPAALLEAVSTIAATHYDLLAWGSAAAEVSTSLVAETQPELLVAVMVHPPRGPEPISPWDWRFRVQVAAALVASRLGPRAPTSKVPLVLDALVHGPVDWTTSAAIIALLEIAVRDPKDAPAVASFLQSTARRPMSPIWWMCGLQPSLSALLDIPGLPESVYDDARAQLREADGD